MQFADMITPSQCRAARALIGMTQPQLAAASAVSLRTISHFEKEQRNPIPANMAALQRALEVAGVRFTETGVEMDLDHRATDK